MAKRLEISNDFSPVFNRMIELCNSRNTTISALLDKFASSRSAIGAWKKGNIDAETIANIAEQLNVSIEYLVTGKKSDSALKQELTALEEKLISDFRMLNQQGQEYIQQQMFIAKEIYQKYSVSETE